MKSINDCKTEIIDVLNKGIEQKLITKADYDKALTTFETFVASHPDYVFLSPKERREAESSDPSLIDEQLMWEELQPILDKAQAIQPINPTQAAEILRSAREDNPLHVSDFTSEDLEKLKVLAPEEYKILATPVRE